MVVINSNFMGNFKLGDNIVYNLKSLEVLYSHYNSDPDYNKPLLKPMIVIIISVIEAVLYDFHLKARNLTKEGIANIPAEVLDYIRGKKLDKLELYIVSAKKHDLFALADTDFYDAIDELRKLRNRIHIQNEKNDFEADDEEAFCTLRKEQAEKVLEEVLKTMASKYGRGTRFNHVADFVLPWNPHF